MYVAVVRVVACQYESTSNSKNKYYIYANYMKKYQIMVFYNISEADML